MLIFFPPVSLFYFSSLPFHFEPQPSLPPLVRFVTHVSTHRHEYNTLFEVWAKLLAWNYFYFQVSLRYSPFVCRSLTNNVPSRNYNFFFQVFNQSNRKPLRLHLPSFLSLLFWKKHKSMKLRQFHSLSNNCKILCRLIFRFRVVIVVLFYLINAIVIDKDITKNLCFFFSQRESLILSRLLMDML